MTHACQKRGGEVTPSAYDDREEDRRRRGEWGHDGNVEPSFPEGGGQQEEDVDDSDKSDGMEKHNHEAWVLIMLINMASLTFLLQG